MKRNHLSHKHVKLVLSDHPHNGNRHGLIHEWPKNSFCYVLIRFNILFKQIPIVIARDLSVQKWITKCSLGIWN